MSKIKLADKHSQKALATSISEEAMDDQGNNTLKQVLKHKNRAFRALSGLAEAVSTQLSVDTVLEQALEQTLETLEVEAGAITLVDEATEELVFRVQKGWQVHNFVQNGIHIRPGLGLSGLVMRTGRPAVTADVKTDPRIAVTAFREEPVKAMVMAPMRARGRVIGLLSVMSYRPRRFTEDEVALLAAVADQVGVAVDNAQLYEREQSRRQEAEVLLTREHRRVEQMALLREATINMTNTTSSHEMLTHLAKVVSQITHAPTVEVDLLLPGHDALTFGAVYNMDNEGDPLTVSPKDNPVARKALTEKRIVTQSIDAGRDDFVEEITQVIAIPMNQQVPTGIILLGYYEATELDKQTNTSLAMLADQAAMILDHLRLYKQEHRKSVYLTLVNQIEKAAVAGFRDEQFLAQVVEMIQRGFGFYNVSLYTTPPWTLHASSGGRSVFPGAIVDQGLPLIAVEQGRTLCSNNVENDPRCATPPWVQDHAHSEMAVPIVQRQQVLGILDIFSSETKAFDQLDTETMTTLAGQLAEVLESGRLYSMMEKRVTELSTLQDMTVQLLGAHDTVQTIRTIAQYFLDLLKANAVTVHAVRDNRIVLPGVELSQPGHQFSDDATQILRQEVLTLREPLTSGNIEGLSYQHHQSVSSKGTNGGTLVLPLNDWGTTHGIVALVYNGVTHFSEDDQRTLNLLINLASVGLTKATLYEDSQQQVRELSLLYKIALTTRALTSSLEIALAVTTALRKTLGWQRAEVYRLDEKNGGLVLLRDKEEFPMVLPLGEGLIGWVAEHRRPLSTNHRSSKAEEDESDLNTEIAVPMMVNDRLTGVLYARSDRHKPFTVRDENFLTTVAHLIAVALDNVELYDQTKNQLHETATLNNIIRAISRSLKIEDILQDLAKTASDVLHARGGCIALIDNNKELVIRAFVGVSEEWSREICLGTAQEVTQKVLLTRKPYYIPDVHKAENLQISDRAVRSLLIVPLISSERQIIGILSVNSARPHAFTASDEHLLTIAAGHAAITIENAHLYEELQQRNQQLNDDYRVLQGLNELKDQIIQNVSHELRTPLTFIKGYIELLTESGMGDLNKNQRKTLDIITEKADQMVRIVTEILSLQQLNVDRIEQVPIPVDELLTQVATIFRNKAASHSMYIHLHPIDDEIEIYGDPERVKQACYNILDNAVKFSPDGGSIWVSATAEDDNVHMVFRDEGIGIPEDRLDQIFQTFYQVDGSATRHFGGLGLGLAVVRHIVEAHKGKVWAESKVDTGSAFHVLLPRYISQDKGSIL